MWVPVATSSLTTLAAFIPLLMFGGPMGQVILTLPTVLLCIIVASLAMGSAPLDVGALLAEAGDHDQVAEDPAFAGLTPATREQLRDLRTQLLNLHKVLLDDAKAAYELDRGRVGGNATLLQLVISDPWFAWLHRLSSENPNKQSFSSLMFLAPTPPRLTRRSRLDQILLLPVGTLVKDADTGEVIWTALVRSYFIDHGRQDEILRDSSQFRERYGGPALYAARGNAFFLQTR